MPHPRSRRRTYKESCNGRPCQFRKPSRNGGVRAWAIAVASSASFHTRISISHLGSQLQPDQPRQARRECVQNVNIQSRACTGME